MDNREKLRKAIKTRLIVMSLATLLPIVVLILFNLPVFQDRDISDFFVIQNMQTY